MIPLFIGLTIFNLLGLTIASALGYGVSLGYPWSTYHQLAGALATIACCGVHCVVFTYFMATAKWVQHAITVKSLDPAMGAPTRSFKAQAFPAALIAMAIVFATAVVGAATFSYRLRPTTHHVLAVISIVTNVVCAIIEYRAISRQGLLIDSVLAAISARPAI